MRILIFHARLAHLTGGEVNARDWALGLKARGHKVIFYALEPGPLAQQIRDAGIAVVTDPSSVAEAPDVMFGSGVNDVVSLIARFPHVPAIQVAQIWNHWNAYPCLLPQVVLHVAVDDLNAEMLVNEFGIPRDRIRVVLNAVDLNRVVPRKQPLPRRPARALVIVKQRTPYLEVVSAACAAQDIAVDFVGYAVDRPLYEPMAAIPDYDLVIGAARTALEGAVGGAAVIVADQRGLAGLLTTANLDRFRKENFGRELLTRPIDAETLGAEISKYDPVDAAAVAEGLKKDASLSNQIQQFEAIFADAIDQFRRSPPMADEARKALSTYLSRHLPRPWEPSPRHSRLQGGMFFEEQIKAVRDNLKEVETRRSKLSEQVVDLDARYAQIKAEEDQAVAEQFKAVEERAASSSAQLRSATARIAMIEHELSSLREVEPLLHRKRYLNRLLLRVMSALRLQRRPF